MNANLYGVDGSVKGSVELPASVFGVEPNEALLHTVINGYLANQRQGTAKTKGRSEVSGGGRKPWKQKGTGRARAGSTLLLYGFGVVRRMALSHVTIDKTFLRK